MKVFKYLMVFGLTACGDAPAPWAGAIESDGDVTFVSNPIEPLDVEGVIELHPLWSYSGPQSGDVWIEPSAVRVDENSAYVLDPRASQVHVVGLDGSPRFAIGRPGEGPDEYDGLTAAVPTSSGLFVVDGGNSRLDVRDRAGTTVRSQRIDGVVFDALPWGDDEILIAGMVGESVGWRALDGLDEPMVVDAPDFDPENVEEGACTRRTTAGRSHVLLRCSVGYIEIYAPSGDLTERIRLAFPPVVVTDAEVAERVRAVRESLGERGAPTPLIEQIVRSVEEGSREKGLYRKVVVDEEAGVIAIWAQNPDDFGGGPATLHLLSRGGVYLRSFEAEHSWNDFDMKGGTLFTLAPDPETGLVALSAMRLDVPPELTARAEQLHRLPGG